MNVSKWVALRHSALVFKAASADYSSKRLAVEGAMNEMRSADGGAGDVDHGKIGYTYGQFGKPDPQIAAQINRTLDDAIITLNVGAGPDTYKSLDRDVKAVDPSSYMRSQPARSRGYN